MEEYYKILELHPGATKAQIRKAYLRLAKKYHPDKNNQKKGAEEKFKAIQQAYHLLSNYQEPEINLNQSSTQTSRHPSTNWAEAFRWQQQKIQNHQKEQKRQLLSWYISIGFIAFLALFAFLGIRFSSWWFLILGVILLSTLIISIILHYKKTRKNKANTHANR